MSSRLRKSGEGYGGGPTPSQKSKAQQKALQRAMMRRIEHELREQKEAKDGQAGSP